MTMDSIWNNLGLEDNPYDHRPLTISDRDRKLFVGRTTELTQLNTAVTGNKGGIIVVEGSVGVGKTSFVNIFQHTKCTTEKILPSYAKIELNDNLDSVSFMLSVLSNMIFNLEKMDSNNLLKRDGIHKQAKSLIEKTIESGWGGSILIPMMGGGGISRQKSVSQPAAVVLPTILIVMDKWIDFVINKLGYSSIVVPIDNFDIVTEDAIIEFLNTMRDTLIGRNNVWWILIGQKGLFSLLEKRAHRVSEVITGKPIILNSLTLDEVHKMIDLRYKNLQKSSTVERIIPSGIIDVLYDTSNGEARFILKRTTDLVLTFFSGFPSETKISLAAAQGFLYKDAKTRIENAGLTRKQLEILSKMVNTQFQPKEFARFGVNSTQALKVYVDRFVDLGLVRKEDTSGKAVYYRTTGDVNIYFNKEQESKKTK